jgi:putative ABC transport system permease protein
MIGLLEMRRRKLQFVLIALIVTLISYLVLMINGLGVGLNELAGSALRNFDADAIAYSDQAGLSVIRSEMSEEAIAAASAGPGVEEAAPLGYVAANYRTGDGDVNSAAFLGYDPGTIGEPSVVSGRPLAPGDRNGALADSSFLRAAGLAVGDTMTVSVRLDSREFTIVGEINEGAFFFQPAVYILRDTLRQMKYGDLPPEEQPAASIVLLKGSNLTGRFDGYEVVDKSTAFANIEGVSGQQATVTSLRLFGYLIGALVIGVFFYVLTLQKVAQIGVLKAVGASSFYVFRQILLQVVAISALGIAISVPLAYLTERLLARLPETVPVAFTSGTFITTSLALLLTAIVGALFSGRHVVRVDPIIALGQQQ